MHMWLTDMRPTGHPCYYGGLTEGLEGNHKSTSNDPGYIFDQVNHCMAGGHQQLLCSSADMQHTLL